ncbi:MAG: DNA repair protein RecO, partial [Rhodospirillaceae bacterium]|nr:DNA repair protein RecO [Rhodospirillaceae bacterium]
MQMIQWQDEAVILSVRPHGESSAIVIVLSK